MNLQADKLLTNTVKKVSLKQRKWLKIYTQTLNATEAAMQAYDVTDRTSAANIGYENVRKLDFNALMDAVGLTDENLMIDVTKGRVAEKVIPTAKGLVKVPDHQSRFKYTELALKLKGRLADKLELTGEDGNPLKIEMVAGIGFLNKPND